MKAKRKSKQPPLVAKISEERILQLSNDLSENLESGTVNEWRAVAQYFSGKLNNARYELAIAKLNIAMLKYGKGIVDRAIQALTKFSDSGKEKR